MSNLIQPAIVAVTLGVMLALALLVPYVAAQYRQRGALGSGRVMLAFTTLVYALALVAYVLLPLPTVGPDFCLHYDADPQLRPFRFVSDIVREGADNLGTLVRNPAVLHVALNVLLFIPFGALFRHLTNRSIAAATVAGTATSLLLELTQLTGVWSLFPCAYRVFDVDDLITNTTGALLGATVVAPLLRLLPGQQIEAPAETPRPLTTGRRLLGMVCDLLAVILTGAALYALSRFVFHSLDTATDVGNLFWLVPALGQLALIWWTGATLGEHSIRVRPTTTTAQLTAQAKLIRWAVGIGGYNLLIIPDAGITSMLAFLLVAASAIAAVFTRQHRGLAYLAAGLDLTDARLTQPMRDHDETCKASKI